MIIEMMVQWFELVIVVMQLKMSGFRMVVKCLVMLKKLKNLDDFLGGIMLVKSDCESDCMLFCIMVMRIVMMKKCVDVVMKQLKIEIMRYIDRLFRIVCFVLMWVVRDLKRKVKGMLMN